MLLWIKANEGVISAAASRVAVRVIRTDEERMIAETVCRVHGLQGRKECAMKTKPTNLRDRPQ